MGGEGVNRGLLAGGNEVCQRAQKPFGERQVAESRWGLRGTGVANSLKGKGRLESK